MRRVVITGLGVVAPNGLGREAFWSACVNGRSGVGPIRSFDASGHSVKIAAEVSDFNVGTSEKSLGAGFNARDFHSVVIDNGAMPLAVLEGIVVEWIARREGKKP